MSWQKERANGGTYFSDSMIFSIKHLIAKRKSDLVTLNIKDEIFHEEMDRIEKAINNEWNYLSKIKVK